MLSSRHARTRRLTSVLVGALLGVALTAGPSRAAAVDGYSRYEPQTTCATSTKPGTEFLLRWLVEAYPGTAPSSTLRECTSGGTSEHKDGRALDWAVDADDPTQRAKAEAFLQRIFAADRDGNRHALARRMGIMYLIWNDHVWSAYNAFERRDYIHSACEGRPLRKCSKTLRHRDHVHISLSEAGAAAQTSFYRAREVPSIPVLEPGTSRLDPVDTAVVRITVPADGETVRTDFKLTRGTAYRVVADGRYRYGPATRVGDAACRWSDGGWTPHDTGLLLNGTSPWADRCTGSQTHEATYKPRRTSRLKLRIADATPADNAGSVTFYLLRKDLAARTVATRPDPSTAPPRPVRRSKARGKRLKDETVTVSAAAPRGARTDRGLRRKRTYRVVVTGVARSGRTRFDGRCVRYAGRFEEQHSLDLATPAADHLSLFIQGVPVRLRAPGPDGPCSTQHRYVGRFRPAVAGKARIRIWDPYSYADNTGALTVRIKRTR